jgi:hypothetical protein
MSLHPDHLADLHASGLSEDTIERLAFESVRPSDLKGLEGVRSAYRIPYFTIGGVRNGFSRLKLFPPLKKNGHTQKYSQEVGSDPHLYFPPLLDWQSLSSDAIQPLLIVEGEKKTASLSQEGFPCVGVPGVWAWRQKVEGQSITIPALDQFVWQGRHVEIIPDSDAWWPGKDKDILAGFYALLQDLTQRGATGTLVKLPDTGGIKLGLDDWLVAEGSQWRHSWKHLERISLDDKRLKGLATWYQRWHHKQEAILEAEGSVAPEVTQVGGVMRFFFPPWKLTLTLDRLKDSPRTGPRGELTITTTMTGIPSHITTTQISLMAGRTRQTLAKDCSQIFPDPPWRDVLEYVCTEAVKSLRQGEPLIQLTDDLLITPPQFCIAPLIFQKHPTILYGDGDACKSYLAILMALLAGSVGTFAGLHVATPLNVLFLDYESDMADVGSRAQRLRQSHPELAKGFPFYKRAEMPIEDDLSKLQHEVAEKNIQLLIVDSLGAACGGDLMAPETAQRLFRALRTLRIASLIIAHTPKNAETASIFGSVFFKNYARWTWEVKKTQEPGESVAKVGLFHRKHNLGSEHAPLGFQFTFHDNQVKVASYNVTDNEALSEALPLSQQIQRALRNGLKTVEDLASELGKDKSIIRARLNDGRGIWAISVKTDGETRWGIREKRT